MPKYKVRIRRYLKQAGTIIIDSTDKDTAEKLVEDVLTATFEKCGHNNNSTNWWTMIQDGPPIVNWGNTAKLDD